MAKFRITTQYVCHPTSNSGAYRAKGLGHSVTVRTDQNYSDENNHRLAAIALLDRCDIPRTKLMRTPHSNEWQVELT